MWRAGLAVGLWAMLAPSVLPQVLGNSGYASAPIAVPVLPPDPAAASDGIPVLSASLPRGARYDVFYLSDGAAVALPLAATLPAFRGKQQAVWMLPTAGGMPTLYARVVQRGGDSEPVVFSASTLKAVLARGEQHARMISLAFGALTSLSLAALLIWFVLVDRLLLLYALLFFLQALYIAFLSGQGFAWPLLAWAGPLGSHAWNLPVGLSGAVGCLFTREIADLKHFSPRIYAVYGRLAWIFVAITLANVGQFVGLGALVHVAGNLLFLGSAVFTVVVAFLAWRAGNRAAGWFLIAWALLEGVTMTAAIRFLLTASDEGNVQLYYLGLPLGMVTAAVLIALGVADRVRQQRLRLTEAERRAQTDPLTGVLNRRSLIERLDAASLRARARGLPIALLFLDLDHFKEINDTHGHAAGDACLRAVVGPIQAELRQSDTVGRYGGEEFVVILSGADSGAARLIAERILERVANVRVDGFGMLISLTCSIGIASSDALGLWGEHLLERADAAVYEAKRSGRNRVHMAPPLAA